MGSGIYLDSLDDTIIRRESESEQNKQIARVCSITRRTIFAAALTGSPVKIPEQWICSSPTAHLSLAPIIRSYLEHRARNPFASVAPPIIIPFFKREGGHSFARAMAYRLRNSRIQLHKSFLAEIVNNQRETIGRLDLAAEVMEAVANGDAPVDQIAVRLHEATVPPEIAENLGLIAKYLELPRTTLWVDMEVTKHWLAKSHDLVVNRLSEPSLQEAHPDLMGGLNELIQSAKSTGIPTSNFVRLWKYSEDNCSKEVTSAIVHTMRSGMHSGIAAWTDSARSTAAAHIFQDTITAEFDKDFSRTIGSDEDKLGIAVAEDFINWSTPESESEPTEREWAEIFMALWALKSDPRYDETLIELKDINNKNYDLEDRIFPLLRLLKQQLTTLRVGLEEGRFTVGGMTKALSEPATQAYPFMHETPAAIAIFSIGAMLNLTTFAMTAPKASGVAQINRITKNLKKRAKYLS